MTYINDIAEVAKLKGWDLSAIIEKTEIHIIRFGRPTEIEVWAECSYREFLEWLPATAKNYELKSPHDGYILVPDHQLVFTPLAGYGFYQELKRE
jgi:hypothetical protein